MPSGCPAFKIGERIRFASIFQLSEIEAKLREQREKIDSGELPFGICDIFVDDLTAHSGEEAEIRSISTYHFGIPIYEFHDVLGRWPEEALCDPLIDRASEDTVFEPAELHYSVHIESLLDQVAMVTICGLTDGKTYWSARRTNAEWIAKGIRQITKIRCKHAFETLFMFDGTYDAHPQC